MTLREVAALAEVSVKTASRALTGDPAVRDATRASVMEAARRLDYVPNRAARTMRTGRTGLVALVGHGIATSPFATDIVRGLEAGLEETGSALMIANADGRGGDAAQRLTLEFRPDAVVLATNYHRDAGALFAPRHARSVLLNCFVHGCGAPTLLPDDEGGAALQARAALEAGHRRVALIELSEGAEAQRLRRAGLARALAEAGAPLDPALIRPGKAGPEGARRTVAFEAAREVLDRPDRPTALICSKDEFALQALMAAASLGLRVPEDVSVIGFDDLALISEATRPGLTTVALPYAEMGRLAAEAALADAPAAGPVRVPCRLVRRGSLGSAPAGAA